MGSAVTTLNRYTKTIMEFKYKRRNIEKSLMIKQKLMELDPDHMWDLYLTAPPTEPEQLLPPPPANGLKPPTGAYAVEMDDGSDQQGEAYC